MSVFAAAGFLIKNQFVYYIRYINRMAFSPFWLTAFLLDQRKFFEHFCIDLESVGRFSFFYQNLLKLFLKLVTLKSKPRGYGH